MLRYVSRIDRCPAVHVRLALPLPGGLHVHLSDYVPWERLPIVGLASLEVADSVSDSATRTFTTKLTAVLPSRPVSPSVPTAYRLTLTNGTQLLVGLSRAPYPVVTATDAHPDRPAERCACTLTVTWTDEVGALEIVG